MDLEDVVAPELRPVVRYLFTGDEGALRGARRRRLCGVEDGEAAPYGGSRA